MVSRYNLRWSDSLWFVQDYSPVRCGTKSSFARLAVIDGQDDRWSSRHEGRLVSF